MPSPHAITLLHLSDTQFGPNHRFGGLNIPPPDDSFDTLLTRLLDDLRTLEKKQKLRPDIIVLSGDLTASGKRSEFDDCLKFVEGLVVELGCPRDRVVIIPGNYDVNREACQAYFLQCQADEKEPERPFWSKWSHYVLFFSRFYRDQPQIIFTKEQPWTLYEIPDLKVVIAGINSTMRESHQDHYGYVGEAQLRWFADTLKDYRDREWLRIAAIHHNIRRGPVTDDENLQDFEDLRRVLGDSVNLFLHGHTYDGKTDWLNNKVPILATGSAALNVKERPEETSNQYQIVQIWADASKRWARAYSHSNKRWEGDTKASRLGDAWWDEQEVPFEKVTATFGQTTKPMSETVLRGQEWDREAILQQRIYHGDDFLAKVEAVYRLREPGADIERIQGGISGVDYLRVSVKQGNIVVCHALGASDRGVDDQTLGRFLTVHRRYQEVDPSTISEFVYGGDPAPEELVTSCIKQRVNLISFIEYQGLIDFRLYLQEQNRRLATDIRYPASLYVPQRMTFSIGRDDEQSTDNVLSTLKGWLNEPHGRFILVLGDFGTGKTFLLHELARQLAEESSSITPIFVPMRSLEKSNDLESLIAQHLAQAKMERIDLAAFRYMLEQGRIVLLFDGYDELALRVTYERAAEHFQTLLMAAIGEAKIVATSRRQHFLSESQVKSELYQRVEQLRSRRIVHLQRFNRDQILMFLCNRLQDEQQARERLDLLQQIQDLLGLSENPRMLSFIADLPEEDLRKAQREKGEITSAELYRLLLGRWLAFEVQRVDLKGAPPMLSVEDRWQAATRLALVLWAKTEPTVNITELTREMGEAIASLDTLKLDLDQAAHQVASGTLLTRDEYGNFGFIHQSVLEWLVADYAAQALRQDGHADVLSQREMSPLMADFLSALTSREAIRRWTDSMLSSAGDEQGKRNALLILSRLGEDAHAPVQFAGQNVRGKDFSGRNLTRANFQGADLTAARLVGCDLRQANLTRAVLTDADLSRSNLRGADLRDADLSRAQLLGADLRGVRFHGSRLHRAKLVGARLHANALRRLEGFGYAPPYPERIQPLIASSVACKVVAWSIDGTLLASGHDDGSIRLWDIERGQELQRLTGHEDTVSSVAFSPDGHTLASGAGDRTVRLWAVASGEERQRLTGHEGTVWSVAFSPDGHTLASGSEDRTVRLWAVASGEERQRLTGHEDTVWSVAFSPDGHTLASGSWDRTVRLWAVASGEERQRLTGHEDTVWSVAFSPDGHTLASASFDNTVRLWDVQSGECLAILGHLRDGWIAYTPNGRYKLGGDIRGGFWHAIGLCRFEPGELDPYLPQPLRMRDDELLVPRPRRPEACVPRTEKGS